MKVYAKVTKYISYLKGKLNPQTKYRLVLQSRGTAGADDVINEAAGHCDIKPMKLREAMEALSEAITHFILLGFDVRVPGLGNICLQLRAKEVDTPEACTRETFKNESQPINVSILPTESLKETLKNISLHVLKLGEEPEDSNSDDNDQNQGQQNNNGQQQTTKRRITFKFMDGTEDDAEYEVGETIVYPQNTQDYLWPSNKPATMPDHDVTVTEELDANLDPGV